MATEKGKVKLLTGEFVKTYLESIELRAIKTHTPDKWVFIDFEKGDIYCWDHQKQKYKNPSTKIRKMLIKALNL